MKSILFLLVAIVATMPLRAGDPFDPVLVNISDPAQGQAFIDEFEPILDYLDPPNPPAPPFSCYNDASCQSWGDWNKSSAIVSHPSYPDCPIYIVYNHRICIQNQSIVQHHITSMSFKENAPECQALKTWLYGPGGTTGSDYDPDRLNQLYHDLYALLAKEMFIEFNNDLMTQFDDTLYCDDYTHYKVSYVKGTCTGWCMGFYKLTIFGFEISFTLGVPENCDAVACCKVSNKFCINRDTGKLIHEEEITPGPQPVNCETQPITEQECYEIHNAAVLGDLLEQVRVKNCKPACDIEFLNLGGDVIVE